MSSISLWNFKPEIGATSCFFWKIKVYRRHDQYVERDDASVIKPYTRCPAGQAKKQQGQSELFANSAHPAFLAVTPPPQCQCTRHTGPPPACHPLGCSSPRHECFFLTCVAADVASKCFFLSSSTLADDPSVVWKRANSLLSWFAMRMTSRRRPCAKALRWWSES